ncbi:isoprenyl transferase [candidate division KSB1 bacterium]|jgi:undecaprenyl diphosphate synthase|nr:isoprenyl transferase [candidate division KSB1 bacterium]
MDSSRIEKIKERGRIPNHVAIIMDGNGRWARSRGLNRTAGHKEGIESVRAAVEAAGHLEISALTLYTFSCENWNRPKTEITTLMSLLLTTIKNEVDELNEKNVRLRVVGNLDALPLAPRIGIRNTINRLKNNTGLQVCLALSYGSRQEITNVTRSIATDVKKGILDPKDIDETLISQRLETAPIGDPDLLIRTSGELRLSNFLLWQMAYTEIYITETLWPDFRYEEFFQAIEDYQARERRYGKVSEQLQQL